MNFFQVVLNTSHTYGLARTTAMKKSVFSATVQNQQQNGKSGRIEMVAVLPGFMFQRVQVHQSSRTKSTKTHSWPDSLATRPALSPFLQLVGIQML